MNTRKANFVVDFNLYHDALKTCIHDDDWLQKAFSDKENIVEFAKQFVKTQPEKVVNEFCYSKDISTLLKNKKTKVLSENELLFLFDQNSEDTKINLINSIKNKTAYFGQATASLLREYCENTRDFFDATIIPHPSKMSETVRPVKKFGIVIEENKSLIFQLHDKGAVVLSEGTQFINLKKYLKNRYISKELIHGYLDLNENTFKQLSNKLNFYKEVEIPRFKISNQKAEYKVVLRKNQTFTLDENIMSISGKNLKVLAICRTNHE